MTKSPQKETQDILTSIKASRNEISTSKGAIKRLQRTAEKSVEKVAKLTNKLKGDLAIEKSEVERIRKETKREYNRFATTYRAATNKVNGVEVRHRKIATLHNNASTLENEISKNATKSRNTLTSMAELHTSAKKNEKEIDEVHGRAENVKKQIEETYGIVVDTTLAGALKERKVELQPQVELWRTTYICTVILIITSILAIVIVNFFKPAPFSSVLTERFVFLTPLALIALVASRQFNHERKLLEEYSFKVAAAQALKGYTNLLNTEFKDLPGAREEILRFSITAMEGIYDRKPLEARLGSYHFIFGNKLAKIEAKIEEKMNEVKDEIQKEKEVVEKIADESVSG